MVGLTLAALTLEVSTLGQIKAASFENNYQIVLWGRSGLVDCTWYRYLVQHPLHPFKGFLVALIVFDVALYTFDYLAGLLAQRG